MPFLLTTILLYLAQQQHRHESSYVCDGTFTLFPDPGEQKMPVPRLALFKPEEKLFDGKLPLLRCYTETAIVMIQQPPGPDQMESCEAMAPALLAHAGLGPQSTSSFSTTTTATSSSSTGSTMSQEVLSKFERAILIDKRERKILFISGSALSASLHAVEGGGGVGGGGEGDALPTRSWVMCMDETYNHLAIGDTHPEKGLDVVCEPLQLVVGSVLHLDAHLFVSPLSIVQHMRNTQLRAHLHSSLWPYICGGMINSFDYSHGYSYSSSHSSSGSSTSQNKPFTLSSGALSGATRLSYFLDFCGLDPPRAWLWEFTGGAQRHWLKQARKGQATFASPCDLQRVTGFGIRNSSSTSIPSSSSTSSSSTSSSSSSTVSTPSGSRNNSNNNDDDGGKREMPLLCLEDFLASPLLQSSTSLAAAAAGTSRHTYVSSIGTSTLWEYASKSTISSSSSSSSSSSASSRRSYNDSTAKASFEASFETSGFVEPASHARKTEFEEIVRVVRSFQNHLQTRAVQHHHQQTQQQQKQQQQQQHLHEQATTTSTLLSNHCLVIKTMWEGLISHLAATEGAYNIFNNNNNSRNKYQSKSVCFLSSIVTKLRALFLDISTYPSSTGTVAGWRHLIRQLYITALCDNVWDNRYFQGGAHLFLGIAASIREFLVHEDGTKLCDIRSSSSSKDGKGDNFVSHSYLCANSNALSQLGVALKVLSGELKQAIINSNLLEPSLQTAISAMDKVIATTSANKQQPKCFSPKNRQKKDKPRFNISGGETAVLIFVLPEHYFIAQNVLAQWKTSCPLKTCHLYIRYHIHLLPRELTSMTRNAYTSPSSFTSSSTSATHFPSYMTSLVRGATNRPSLRLALLSISGWLDLYTTYGDVVVVLIGLQAMLAFPTPGSNTKGVIPPSSYGASVPYNLSSHLVIASSGNDVHDKQERNDGCFAYSCAEDSVWQPSAMIGTATVMRNFLAALRRRDDYIHAGDVGIGCAIIQLAQEQERVVGLDADSYAFDFSKGKERLDALQAWLASLCDSSISQSMLEEDEYKELCTEGAVIAAAAGKGGLGFLDASEIESIHRRIAEVFTAAYVEDLPAEMRQAIVTTHLGDTYEQQLIAQQVLPINRVSASVTMIVEKGLEPFIAVLNQIYEFGYCKALINITLQLNDANEASMNGAKHKTPIMLKLFEMSKSSATRPAYIVAPLSSYQEAISTLHSAILKREPMPPRLFLSAYASDLTGKDSLGDLTASAMLGALSSLYQEVGLYAASVSSFTRSLAPTEFATVRARRWQWAHQQLHLRIDEQTRAPKTHWMTMASKHTDNLQSLKVTAMLAGIDLVVIGQGKNVTPGAGAVFTYADKLRAFNHHLFGAKQLQTISDDDIVVLIDAYDVLLFPAARRIGTYMQKKASTPIIFCVENGIYPEYASAALYGGGRGWGEDSSSSSSYDYTFPDGVGQQRFLNSGCIVGRAGQVREMIKAANTLGDAFRNDQQYFVRYMLTNPDLVSLDTRREIFITGYKELRSSTKILVHLDLSLHYVGEVSLHEVGVVHCNNIESNGIYAWITSILGQVSIEHLQGPEAPLLLSAIYALMDGRGCDALVLLNEPAVRANYTSNGGTNVLGEYLLVKHKKMLQGLDRDACPSSVVSPSSYSSIWTAELSLAVDAYQANPNSLLNRQEKAYSARSATEDTEWTKDD